MKSIGYKTEEKTVTLKKGKTLEINFNAEEDAVSLDGVLSYAEEGTELRVHASVCSSPSPYQYLRCRDAHPSQHGDGYPHLLP